MAARNGDQHESINPELLSHRLLSPEEERDLALRIGQGDRTARDTLVVHNLRWVLDLAKRWHRPGGASVAELFAYGCEGLLDATRTFNPDGHEKARFSTHATFWIRRYFKVASYRFSRSLVAGETHFVRYREILDLIDQLSQHHGRPVNYDELARSIGLPSADVEKLLTIVPGEMSLDQPLVDGEDCLADLVAGQDDPLQLLNTRLALEQALVRLERTKPKWAAVVRAYYGIGGIERTVGELAAERQFTQEGVRNQLRRGLRALRIILENQKVTPEELLGV